VASKIGASELVAWRTVSACRACQRQTSYAFTSTSQFRPNVDIQSEWSSDIGIPSYTETSFQKFTTMFIYVDESGHSGAQIFKDIKAQPNMYYGVMTSKVDLSIEIADALIGMRKLLGVDRIHASALGNPPLVRIAPQLLKIQNELGLVFDFYILKKRAHAEFCFFDQVFDSGNNKAVPHGVYFSPFRYVLILELKRMFNDSNAERAWNIRIALDDKKANQELSVLCRDLLKGIGRVKHYMARYYIRAGLRWAAEHPNEISYNASDEEGIKQISPNIICFQSVMHGIARRVREEGAEPTSIIVDQQQEFNSAQKVLADFYASAAGIKFENAPKMPVMTFDGMPQIPIQFVEGKNNCGLELVDIYLWVFKRLFEKKPVANELLPLYEAQIDRGYTDQISYEAIMKRFLENQ
jgi:hypothetical protein